MVVEVEVMYFNLLYRRHLVLSLLASRPDGSLECLHGRPLPGEHPSVTARRLVSEVVGAKAVVHEPVMTEMCASEHGPDGAPVVTLCFALLGPIPNRNPDRWVSLSDLDERKGLHPTLEPIRDRIVKARRALLEVMCEQAVVFAIDSELAPPKSFTLDELWQRYQWVGGPTLRRPDQSNLRKMVEKANGFLVRIEPDDAEGLGDSGRDGAGDLKRGRPPRRYRAGATERIEPPLRLG